MGPRGLRRIPALIVGAVVVVASGACGRTDLGTLVARHGLPGAAVVRVEEGLAVAARAEDGGVQVLAFLRRDGGWDVQSLASASPGSNQLVQMVTMSGETGMGWSSFVYGLAGPDVSRVVLVGLDGVGGQVVGGAWVIALRQRDLSPRDLRWQFLSVRGGVLGSGVGIRGDPG